MFVNGNPPVRFYCGTPLIASNGHRLGTLCFADHEPHTFDAERCNILNNMAELCVREIERESMLRKQTQEPSEIEQVTARTLLLLLSQSLLQSPSAYCYILARCKCVSGDCANGVEMKCGHLLQGCCGCLCASTVYT